ncbi:Cysteine proteinases superfamily protein isoform 2 [Theobroma cacao]|uniref:Ubiquitin thioesterase OTU n=1 Tax=Theobroma cacao TaxID=3641 RepID=A0A061ESE2_THECC|nr:Cysteine proteinases superfamily protein isoform 2 [Theobroma cacao]
MADKVFNENILEQIRHGIAQFELVSSPVSSVSTPSVSHSLSAAFLGDSSSRFFARIGPSLGSGSPATKKVEHFSVHKVTGDGRCLFRALVKGMALHKGIALRPQKERDDADELRMAVKEVLCDSGKDRQQYEEALVAITVEESLKRNPCDENLSTAAVTANAFNNLIFGEESQSSWCFQDCAVSQLLSIYLSMSIGRVDGVQVLFPLQNTELSSARAPEKQNPGKS